MKVYIDLIVIINYMYDLMILTSVSILLKRHPKTYRLLLGSLLGSITIITLFIRLSPFILLLLKVITSVGMVLISFGPKGFKENIFYLYIITIVIGGSLYLIKDNNYKINILSLLILSPIITYLYIKSSLSYKEEITKLYDCVITNKKEVYSFTGYMDTGNTLKDPITKLPVILINKKLKSNKKYYVPYKVLNNESILECIKVDNVIINNKRVEVLLGNTTNNIFPPGIDIILNELIREEINC